MSTKSSTPPRITQWLYYRDELGPVRRTRRVQVERHQQYGAEPLRTSRWFYCINCHRVIFGTLRWCCAYTAHGHREDARTILWPRSATLQATWLLGGFDAVVALLNDSDPPTRRQLQAWGRS